MSKLKTHIQKKKRKKINDKIDVKSIDRIANILSPSHDDYMEELSIIKSRFCR
jgi:hypothetical protein